MMSQESSFLGLFEKIVQRYPDKPAVVWNGEEYLSFSVLRQRALNLAASLQKQGIKEESLVAIALPKSPHYIVALLAVWYAGGAFLPLDLTQPPERNAEILRKSKAVLAISEENSAHKIHGLIAKTIDVHATESEVFSAAPLYHPERLAYLIFSSGSTGSPKGVLVNHRGLMTVLTQQIEIFALTSSSKALFVLSHVFDASISDIGTSLLSGATLFIEPPDMLESVDKFIRILSLREISYVDLPPSLLPLIPAEKLPSSLATVVIGGEVCPPHAVREWAKVVRLVNVYGPTEATICCSFSICGDDWNRPLIGSPLNGFNFSIRDGKGEKLSQGETGELWISGIGLARGYLDEPLLTAEKFFIKEGTRYYRTGDLVRALPEGVFEFAGRIDRQFKRAGRLIEPAEIESALQELSGVREAGVIFSRNRLIAFLSGDKKYSLEDVRTHLSSKLPDWMIPAHLVILSQLPRTRSGKIDFTSLQDLGNSLGNEIVRSCGSSAREVLCRLFSLVLGKEDISPFIGFLDAGGDSLKALELLSAAEIEGIAIAPELLQRNSSVQELCEQLGDSPPSITTEMLDRESNLSSELENCIKSSLARKWETEGQHTPVFLTGASGYLGSQLLLQLLRRSSAQVCCLVRASSRDAGMAKIRKALADHGEILSAENEKRLLLYCGDITQPLLGMRKEEWNELTESVETVFHCAGEVNDLRSYAELHTVNAAPLRTLLHFVFTRRLKKLHVASTLSVFTEVNSQSCVHSETDSLMKVRFPLGGYAQSKWVAERILENAKSYGAGNITIYRFGLLTPGMRSGRMQRQSSLRRLIKGLALLGSYPEHCAIDLKMDITPVDYAAKCLFELAAKSHQLDIFHIAHIKPLGYDEMIEAFREEGIVLYPLPPDEWRASLGKLPQDESSLSLVSLLSRATTQNSRLRCFDLFEATDARYDTTNCRAVLGNSVESELFPARELMRLYIRRELSKDATGANA